MRWEDFLHRLGSFSAAHQELIHHAYTAGEKAHAGQKRKSGEPYFSHPVAVAEKLIEMGADKDTVIAALLHDSIEDTDLTLQDIEREFGGTVAMLIDGVTKMNEDDMPDSPSLNEKVETLRKMFLLMEKDVRIMVIKIVDRLHNMQTIQHRSHKKQMDVARETLDVYAKIADRLCMRDLRNELEGLCYKVLEPEKYSSLDAIHAENQKNSVRDIALMKKELSEMFLTTKHDIVFEEKSWGKLILQYDLSTESATGIVQMNVAIRCEDIESCYRTFGELHQIWPREAMTFEDFINSPIINGYRGLHTTIILKNGTRVRCKIRTFDMDAYAHHGITLLCFTLTNSKLSESLPWTRTISPLSDDTKDRSEEFWETLQNDILGESIVIYGPSSQTALVPRGATALDGALHLFPKTAIGLTAIRVNGKEVPLSQELPHAAAVDIVVGNEPQATRDWLYWVQTGAGIAMVRSMLAGRQGNLAGVGRSILEHTLRERGHGYMEELSSETIQKGFAGVGYANTDEGYIALAKRHLEPSEALASILRNLRGTSAEQEQICAFVFTMDHNVESVRRLIGVYEKYNISVKNVRMHPQSEHELDVRIDLSLPADAQEAMQQDLLSIGARDVSITVRRRLELLLMGIVVFCWGLNPVWAKYFFAHGITPVGLVSLRSVLFFLMTTTFFILWYISRRSILSPIRNGFQLALLPALSTFLLSLLTYASIAQLPPSIHLTILRFNVLFLPIIHMVREQKMRWRLVGFSAGLFALCLVYLTWFSENISDVGLLLAISALGTYMYYSLTTEQILQRNKIGIRYPYFLFHMGSIVGLFGLVLFPFIAKDIPSWLDQLPLIVAYVFLCVFVPHTCFHIVLQRVHFRHVTSMSLLEVPLAVALEAAILGLFLEPATYLLIGAVLITFLAMLQWKLIR